MTNSRPAETRRHRPARPHRSLWLAVITSLTVAHGALAQPPPGAPASLGEAITSWVRGSWASPVYCRIAGETVRGIRRVLIEPMKNTLPGRTMLTVQFIDMQVDDAERCFDLLGNAVPNLIGKLQLRFNGTSHSETIQRDFERAMKRDRGFEFDVANGFLDVQEVGSEAHEPLRTAFRGGSAWLRKPARGSDSERAVAEFDSPRYLELQVMNREGQAFLLALFLLEMR